MVIKHGRALDDRVSLTIDHDTHDLMAIIGLSMAAHAQLVVDVAVAERILRMFPLKYPELSDLCRCQARKTSDYSG